MEIDKEALAKAWDWMPKYDAEIQHFEQCLKIYNKHPYNPIEQMIDLSSAGIRQQIAALPEGAVTIGVKAEVKYIVPDQPPKTP